MKYTLIDSIVELRKEHIQMYEALKEMIKVYDSYLGQNNKSSAIAKAKSLLKEIKS